MTESQFVEQNKAKWEELESLLLQKDRDADQLQSLFIKVSSDLSYARTFYPNRSVRLYLNNLTLQVFDLIGKQKKRNTREEVVHFFTDVLPYEIYQSRRAILVSLVIFVLAMGIGVLSSIHNPDFAEVILGPRYVSMTEENINNGDPMAVYKDQDQVDMFFGITINNIQVAFLAFILGLFGTIGSFILLMINGIMVGAFQYFFYSKGLFLTSFLTIWIHGTIEISAIVIAGGAGIVLGNGLLFPGTYQRSTSLLIHAKRALRIIMGTIPLFVIAGLLESFVTRKTELPDVIKMGIIGFSALFILIMWVIYPLYYHRTRGRESTHLDMKPIHSDVLQYDKYKLRTFSQIIAIAFTQFRLFFGSQIKYVVIPYTMIAAGLYWVKLESFTYDFSSNTNLVSLFSFEDGGVFLFIFYWIMLTYMLCLLGLYSFNQDVDHNKWECIKKNMAHMAIIALGIVAPFYFLPWWGGLIVLIIITPQFIVYSAETRSKPSTSSLMDYKEGYKLSWQSYGKYILPFLLFVFFYWIALLLSQSGILRFVTRYIEWHGLFDLYINNQLFVSHLVLLITFLIIFPLFYFLLSNQIASEKAKTQAIDLQERLKTFGQSKQHS